MEDAAGPSDRSVSVFGGLFAAVRGPGCSEFLLGGLHARPESEPTGGPKIYDCSDAVGEAAGIVGLKGVNDTVEGELESEDGDAFTVDLLGRPGADPLVFVPDPDPLAIDRDSGEILIGVVVRRQLPLEVLHDQASSGGSPSALSISLR
jgi:hypothetical protein